jgi:hypothetical protein
MTSKLEINAITGEEIVRDYTDLEMEQHEKDLAKQVQLSQAKADREARRKAVIEKLGLTEDEVKSLLS